MHNHAPKDYACPICLGVEGIGNNQTLIRKSDIVYKDNFVTAFISSFFIGENKGHVVVVPNTHIENIYDLQPGLAGQIQDVVRKISLAVRETYGCEGITILQNNEPTGNQHAFHYHVHIFPRYPNDQLHARMMEKETTTPQERLPYTEKLRVFLENLL